MKRKNDHPVTEKTNLHSSWNGSVEVPFTQNPRRKQRNLNSLPRNAQYLEHTLPIFCAPISCCKVDSHALRNSLRVPDEIRKSFHPLIPDLQTSDLDRVRRGLRGRRALPNPNGILLVSFRINPLTATPLHPRA
ncbi:hypothetical protein TNIN_443801 [Trichonephila inaurata madagascariensis]|uniref:Uncharacterized protein n=1 Tax=Trichonephila inaurata madagascariensis TaxID=2747483 RepID=A0A8X6M712_9ARAC|nr:hypothetical protein TNIN_443801 [Trichonephila inaurata madagascariensis]